MSLFDTHTHLESQKFDSDRQEVIARAKSAGVLRMITCGSDIETSAQEIDLALSSEGVHAAVGIHGHEASSAVQRSDGAPDEWVLDDAAFGQLAALASQRGVVAIGEIGLDYHYAFSPRAVQQAVLERQLSMACDLGLPVILHNRESDEDMRRLVDSAPSGLRGVLHCFLSDDEMAQWAVERGLYIGIAGPITFRSAAHLPDIVRQIPRDRLLIETDCPYLAPHPKRGRRNEPAFVRFVAERLADTLGISLEALADQTTENACRLFGVP